jgi:hypothetical protein
MNETTYYCQCCQHPIKGDPVGAGDGFKCVPCFHGIGPHACVSKRRRDEITKELLAARERETETRENIKRLENELQFADARAQVEEAEQRGREWLQHLVRAIQPLQPKVSGDGQLGVTQPRAWLRDFTDRANWTARGPLYEESEFTYVLPSGHKVTVTVRPGGERPPGCL